MARFGAPIVWKWIFSGFFLYFFVNYFIQHSPTELPGIGPGLLASGHWIFLIIAMGLILLNWGLEALRWKALDPGNRPLSLKESFCSVLAGISTGLMTPGRWSEVVGRICVLQEKTYSKAALAWGSGALSMGLITGIAGLTACLTYAHRTSFYPIETLLSSLKYGRLSLATAAVLVLPLACAKAAMRWRHTNLTAHLQSARQAWRRSGWLIVGATALRFAVFVAQFLCLCFFLGLPGEPMIWAELFVLTYWLSGFLPLVTLAEPITRGALALHLYPELAGSPALLYTAPALLWFMNLCLPAVAGWLLLLGYKKKATP
ncbi:MAG: flippase-like domain-containing protein [Flavobacteriales bacterium]|nr:flippase-like domain-containing protein [Flavobacteriales bacterium]